MINNVILGQSGGPTCVINASLCGLIQAAQAAQNMGRVFGMRYGIEGFINDEIIDLDAELTETINQLRHTPSSALGSCRYKLQDSDLPLILARFKRYNIRYCFLIGGNDTMETICRIERYCQKNNYDFIGVGVPKTVDNDLYGTDHAPGFASAAKYIALSTQQSGQLARDMQRVDQYLIHQTVGRDAGWLAASASLARQKPEDAPHLIYMPERKMSKAQFISDVNDCVKRYGWASIVCGEGVVWDDGTLVSASDIKDGFHNVERGAKGGVSAAINLHKIIREATGMRGEFQVSESLAMCAIDRVSAIDAEEAYQCGKKAVELGAAGISGVMVSIRRNKSENYAVSLTSISLHEVARKTRNMPDHFINEAGNDVTQAFTDYLRPLVGRLDGCTSLAFKDVADA
ncbi:MAG: diphosphate--fructose-6-phosphate 1-phosphotransferase [Pseudomonadota bacterium]